jgi:hypothetical protein
MSLGKRALIALGASFALCLIVAFVLVADARAEHFIDKMTANWAYVIDWDQVHRFFGISPEAPHRLATDTRAADSWPTEPASAQSSVAVKPSAQYDPNAVPLKFIFKHPDGCVTCEATDAQLQSYAEALIPQLGFRPPQPDDLIVAVIVIEHWLPSDKPAGQPKDDRYFQCGEYHCTTVAVSYGLQRPGHDVATLHGIVTVVTDQPYVPSVWVDYSNLAQPKPYNVAVNTWLTEFYTDLYPNRIKWKP